MQQIGINTLNDLDQEAFTQLLADIFEHSSWVAERAWKYQPFKDVEALHAAMVNEVSAASLDAQLGLLRAHPELAGREAQAGELTESSVGEQAGAKLDRLSADEMAEVNQLNAAYGDKFGFPFIIAVRNHTKETIFSEFKRRLQNTIDEERSTALAQVAMIARFRLDDLLSQDQASDAGVK